MPKLIITVTIFRGPSVISPIFLSRRIKSGKNTRQTKSRVYGRLPSSLRFSGCTPLRNSRFDNTLGNSSHLKQERKLRRQSSDDGKKNHEDGKSHGGRKSRKREGALRKFCGGNRQRGKMPVSIKLPTVAELTRSQRKVGATKRNADNKATGVTMRPSGQIENLDERPRVKRKHRST